MPIIGTLANSSSRGFGGLRTFITETGAYNSIQTANVGAGGQAYIEFTNIPSTYKHLQIRYVAQDNRTTYGHDQIRMQVGSSNTLDTNSTAYVYHYARGNGATTDGQNFPSSSGDNASIQLNTASGTNVSPGSWGAGIIDITDYSNTSKIKVIKYFSGVDLNGDGSGRGAVPGRIVFGTGMWNGTNGLNAINIIKLFPENGSLFNQHSRFALYGIKDN
jgi:hypothetical protein